jgi:hypothetical protein
VYVKITLNLNQLLTGGQVNPLKFSVKFTINWTIDLNISAQERM